jgi:hypothetical protein
MTGKIFDSIRHLLLRLPHTRGLLSFTTDTLQVEVCRTAVI